MMFAKDILVFDLYVQEVVVDGPSMLLQENGPPFQREISEHLPTKFRTSHRIVNLPRCAAQAGFARLSRMCILSSIAGRDM